jgi:hypothetical protein
MKRGGLRGGILKNKCEAGGALTGTGKEQQNIKIGFMNDGSGFVTVDTITVVFESQFQPG